MPERALRADIQALRGWAVATVVLFHLGIGSLPGGFLGVDVFFVISGYLMTMLIAASIGRGDFTLVGFYFRRAKRLLPAAYVTIAVTAAVAPWCLDAPELRDFAWQVAGAVSFTANVVLWQQTGYFDGAAELKPLLHTWSLSLEEQYYLVLPAALLLVPRRRWGLLLGGAALASGALCAAALAVKPVAAFYLLPTRAWELLIGSLGAWFVLRPRTGDGDRHAAWPKWALPAAIAVLVGLPLHPLSTAHPGLDALLACAATLVVILRRHERAAQVGVVRALARLGDISYSLYLVHWPVLALLRNAWGDPSAALPLGWRIAALAASLGLAVVLYRGVERPLHLARFGPSRRFVAAALAASFALVLALPLQRAVWPPDPALAEIRRATDGFGHACDAPGPAFEPRAECRSRGAPGRVLVWGDSFAMHLVPGLDADARLGGVAQATMNTCGPLLGLAPVRRAGRGSAALYDGAWAARCVAFNDSVLAFLRVQPQVEVVVLSSLLTAYVDGDEWQEVERGGAPQPLQAQRAGKRVVLVAPPPLAPYDAGVCLERRRSGHVALGLPADCRFDAADYHRRRAAALALLDAVERRGLPVIRFDP